MTIKVKNYQKRPLKRISLRNLTIKLKKDIKVLIQAKEDQVKIRRKI